VTSVLEEALGRVVLRESIKLDREVPQDLPGIEIDRSQLVPLLERIITNAQEAMPQGGVLSLKARADNRAVTIGIGDTGIGMNGETRKRIFQPFFTTKPSWIGLGLLLAKETVEANLGRIEFESHPGRGTMFRLRFPAAEARSANNGLEPQVNASKRESGKDETTSERK
jgi:signal transduction histidine kinase